MTCRPGSRGQASNDEVRELSNVKVTQLPFLGSLVQMDKVVELLATAVAPARFELYFFLCRTETVSAGKKVRVTRAEPSMPNMTITPTPR